MDHPIIVQYDEMGRFESCLLWVKEENIDLKDPLKSLIDIQCPSLIKIIDREGQFHIFPVNKIVNIHSHDPKDFTDHTDGEEWKLGLGSEDDPQ